MPRPRGGPHRDADWKPFLPDWTFQSLCTPHFSTSVWLSGLFYFHANVFLQSNTAEKLSSNPPPLPQELPDLVSHATLPADAHEFLFTSWWALCPVLLSPDHELLEEGIVLIHL